MARPTRRLTPVPLSDVTLADDFWAPRVATNCRVTVPHEYEQCRETGRLDSLKLQWKEGDPNRPHIFWDSDIAKWIEAASYCLTRRRSRKIQRLLDEAVDLVVGAQQPDGYLNVHFTVVQPRQRWSNLRDCHELYCAGHLMEAAVAHHEATGDTRLLDALCRYADYIDSVFGPQRGKKKGYPGHEEIELALVKLYRATANERYLKLSKFFVDQRGQQPHYFDQEAKARGDDPRSYWARDYSYNQAHKPVREQDEAVGHSVRAMYLYSGMADIAAETGDEELLDACRRLWDSATLRRMYLTGGVGSAHHGERFTADYELPNVSAYAETCAAIGLVFFAHRMLQIEARRRYADVLERALYNGVLSGIGLDGKSFFYVNPLASNGDHHRRPWFGCACCPPNIARVLASLGRYVYSAAKSALYVHLYIGGSAKAEVAGQPVTLSQETEYPWDGDVTLTVGLDEPATFSVMLRIPGWCRDWTVQVNGEDVEARVTKGYARLRREWRDGDRVELSMAMPVERVVAHPEVGEDAGKVALQRGPLVYCLEQCDHRAPVRSIVLPDDAELTARRDRKLFGGTVVIRGDALAPSTAGWKGRLYRPAEEQTMRRARIKAVPYCLWDNRDPGPMTVWLPRG
ncbi:MAG: glycoside hydrolase family 127 protein [Planctomycetota bacterium]